MEEFEAVRGLVRFGLNDCQIARLTGIPRGTVRYMRVRGRSDSGGSDECPRCGTRTLDRPAYAYLLGIYLGDGCISPMPRGVFKLRIVLDQRYPNIIDEVKGAIMIVRARPGARVGVIPQIGCVEVTSYWKHWPCLFPQHGPGPKWKRDVSLKAWQQAIVDRHPERLLRGFIHSDGCRDANRVGGKSYPRYQFSNNSVDIQQVFRRACEKVGVRWTQPWWKTIAVSRRPDVAMLDCFIGPKN